MSADGGGSDPVGRRTPDTDMRPDAAAEAMPEFMPPAEPDVPIAEALAAADARAHRHSALSTGDAEHDMHALRDAESLAGPLAGRREPSRGERWRVTVPRWMRHPVLAFGLGAAVVATGWFGTPSMVGALTHLEDESAVLGVVTEYITALTSHDAEAANEMVMPDATVASTAMLTNAVYDGVTVAQRFTPQAVHVAGDDASVEVVLGTELWRPVAAVRLERVGSTWELVAGLAVPMHVVDGLSRLGEIEGEPVPADVASGDRAVWLYPGLYWLAPVPAPLLDEQLPYTVEVGSGASELDVRMAPSIALEQSMRIEAASLVRLCVAEPVDGCGDVERAPDAIVSISLLADQGIEEIGDDVVSMAFTATVADGGTVTEHTVVVLADLSNAEHAELVTTVLGEGA